MDVRELRSAATRETQARPWLPIVAMVAGLALALAIIAVILSGVLGRSAPGNGSGATGAPLLWVARDADSTVYLFGSIHALRVNEAWMDQRLYAAFDSADEVWFELADLDVDDESAAFDVRNYRSKRPILTRGLSPSEISELSEFLRVRGWSLDEAAYLPPWLVAWAIEDTGIRARGFRDDRGVDYMLSRRAKSLKKAVKGFETFDQQMGYIRRVGLSQADGGTQALRDALDYHAGRTPPEQDITVIAKYWRNGDEARLTQAVQGQDPESDKILLTERNANWLPQIDAIMAGKGRVFITVGAAHLIGPDGLVALMKHKGYAVEAVRP